MKIPLRYLEHRVTLRQILEVSPSTGPAYEADRTNVRALVVDKVHQVVDQRPSSATLGQTIAATTQIVMRLENYIRPDSEVVLWPGEPIERVCKVVAAGYNRHSTAPESAQLWVI